MMGMIAKSFREAWFGTVLFGCLLLLFEILMNYILPQFQDQLAEMWMQMEFIRTMLSALLGIDVGDTAMSQIMMSLLWVHPMVLALPFAHELILGTRLPAAEIDRGTIDVLLGLPVSRRKIYVAETIVWIGTGLCVLLLGLTGNVLGARITGIEDVPSSGTLLTIIINFFMLYLAVGAFTLFVSACSDRRGRAILVVFTTILLSFLLNFLSQFWTPAETLAFMSVLQYYQPAFILSEGAVPTTDLLTLLGVAVVFWVAGMEVFTRRSICTV